MLSARVAIRAAKLSRYKGFLFLWERYDEVTDKARDLADRPAHSLRIRMQEVSRNSRSWNGREFDRSLWNELTAGLLTFSGIGLTSGTHSDSLLLAVFSKTID